MVFKHMFFNMCSISPTRWNFIFVFFKENFRREIKTSKFLACLSFLSFIYLQNLQILRQNNYFLWQCQQWNQVFKRFSWVFSQLPIQYLVGIEFLTNFVIQVDYLTSDIFWFEEGSSRNVIKNFFHFHNEKNTRKKSGFVFRSPSEKIHSILILILN